MVAADDRHRLAPEVTRGAFPLIATFLRGYLHQDWAMDYESPQDARNAFLEDVDAGERRAFDREVGRLAGVIARLSLGDVTALLTERLGGAWMPGSLDDVRSVFPPAEADEEVDL